MTDRSLIFPRAEYAARIAAFQARMARAGADALLLTSPADVFYTTGFLTRFWESPARPWFIVIPVEGAPVAVIPSIGADLMGRTWLEDIRTWDAPDPVDDGVSLLAETLSALVPDRGRIALPMGLETHLRMPVRDFERVRAALSPRTFVDGTDVVQRVREVKSEAEIAKIRATCGIADRAFARVAEFAAAGATLAHVFRAFQITLLEEGADWVSYVAAGAGQGGYGDVISPAGPEPLLRGDVLMLDTGAVRDGYFCDFDRNFSVGPANDRVRRAHEALVSAVADTARDLRPGMRARDVHRLLCAGLTAREQMPCGGRLGHGLGITLTEWPSFTPKDDTTLRAGMVLTLEPGVDLGRGRIMVHEENIVLREGGAEFLSTPAPPDLPELSG
ncbi:Xaa-Pro aminopeptidase [Rubricella aquisinus]|uniref:Xaa-Pro aminopeptidase n=1 Tax=Rubricella aquisinus TaxID=2028108 RepID=A0A840X2U7_9RHOB|nr:Xaa-Pro aminopeptidase [Rubricella aquisinus]